MILVADGGSTSCDWVCLHAQSFEIIESFKTSGMNPAYTSEEDIFEVLEASNILKSIKNQISSIFFFGAGCNSNIFAGKLNGVFKRYFALANSIRIQGDIQGAVYACTHESGVVAILGTGSNICYYDGSEIRTNIESLGYSVMDDGAGSALGRLLLRAFFYKQLPSHLEDKFSEQYDVNPDSIKNNIYHKPFPGRFMASYAKFVFDNLNEPSIEQILNQNINNFFDTHVVQFQEELKSVPIHFVGSIAYHSREQIQEICATRRFRLGEIIQSPIDPLAQNINHYI